MPEPLTDPLIRNRVPSIMTGGEFRPLAEVISDSANDIITAIRQLQDALTTEARRAETK